VLLRKLFLEFLERPDVASKDANQKVAKNVKVRKPKDVANNFYCFLIILKKLLKNNKNYLKLLFVFFYIKINFYIILYA